MKFKAKTKAKPSTELAETRAHNRASIALEALRLPASAPLSESVRAAAEAFVVDYLTGGSSRTKRTIST